MTWVQLPVEVQIVVLIFRYNSDMKTCTRCGDSKTVEEFPKRQNGQPKSWCKSCRNMYERTRYQTHPGETERKRLESRIRKLGASPEEVGVLVDRSGGLCELCQMKPGTHLDHDHVRGNLRGVLCNSCNTGLGFLGDNLAGVERALHYLKSFG